jgi:transposase
MVQHDYIRFLYYNQNKSQRAIAREMGIHRETVKRAIKNPEREYNINIERDKSVNGEYGDRIRQLIEYNSKQSRNEKLTKTRMHELLCDEGYRGSYSSFTYQTRQIEDKLGINRNEAFLKLLPLKGSLQVDFGEVYVMQNSLPIKTNIFCAKLCYSKVEFVKAYPQQKTEFFFDGLTSAFAFFGGIPKKIIFDNLKPAVKKVLKEQERELQEEFLKFKSFYCFDAEFCAPGKGNEKGLVENLVKYVQNNYFLPRPGFTDYDTLNTELSQKCYQRIKKGKYQGESWEKRIMDEDFIPFSEIYQYARIKEVKVDTYQLIHLEDNRYSVPTKYVGKRVQANIYPFKIRVIYNGDIIAEHDRLFGKNKEHLDPYHFLSLLQKKARAYDQAKVISDWNLPDIYEHYHKMLQAHFKSKSKGTREFIDILRLTEGHTVKVIAKILKELNEKNCYSYQDVLSILRYQTQCTAGVECLTTEKLKSLSIDHITTTYLPLIAYDKLLKEVGCTNE